jgi:DNA modification methylase
MTVQIFVGDCRDVLRGFESESFHCCITSPPYWNLRSYGIGAENGEIGAEESPALYVRHLVEVFREVKRVLRDDGLLWLNLGDSYASSGMPGPVSKKTTWHGGGDYDTLALGRAPTPPGLKPKDLVGIPWRVALALQADGWWLRSAMPWIKKSAMPESVQDRCTTAHEYVFQFAKSERYWCDMEAVKVGAVSANRDDGTGHYRGNRHHKNEVDAARLTNNDNREAMNRVHQTRNRRTSDTFRESLDIRIEDQRAYLAHLEHVRDNGGMMLSEDGSPVAMLVNTASFAGAHFATFPTKLVEPLIACSTSQIGCCSKCGANWERVVEKGNGDDGITWAERKAAGEGTRRGYARNRPLAAGGTMATAHNCTLGWRPTCECSGLVVIGDQPSRPSEPKRKRGESKKEYTAKLLEYDADLALWQTRMDSWRRLWADLKPLYDAETTIPATVLDPFVGAGTTLLQADRMGRHAKGIDISEAYVKMAAERIVGDAPLLVNVVLFSDVTPVPATPVVFALAEDMTK